MHVVEALGSGTAIALSFVAVGCWELALPDRRDGHAFGRRWTSNFSLFAMTVAVQLVLAPGLAVLTSLLADRSPVAAALGAIGSWGHLAVSVLILDGLNYAAHRAYHVVPILWRVHATHHTDVELDFSTTVRHHPGEALLSAVVIGVAGAILGCLPIEVAFYGGLANIVQLIAHANVRLPRGLERALSGIVVTPAFHRIHHSTLPAETDSNFGQVFAFWDRLFGSVGTTADGTRGPAEFGLAVCRDRRSQRLDRVLLQPIHIGRPATARCE